MIDNPRHTRFKDADWYTTIISTEATIGGSGGIGTWLSLLLAKAGVGQIYLYDDDRVELHNMGGQLFRTIDIGAKKVGATFAVVKEFSDRSITPIDGKLESYSPITASSFGAFDNMKARTDMFNNWEGKYSYNSNAILIDGRLTAEQMQIFCIKGGDSSKKMRNIYRTEHLFDDKEVDDAPCTMKQTSHAAAMIAAHMVGMFTNYLSNTTDSMADNSVPFMWSYFIPLNLTETIEYEYTNSSPESILQDNI